MTDQIQPPAAPRSRWAKHDPEEEARIRRFARPKIEGVLDTHPDASGLDLWLLMGKECPFTAQWQRDIWCDEIERVIRERIAKVRETVPPANAERRKT